MGPDAAKKQLPHEGRNATQLPHTVPSMQRCALIPILIFVLILILFFILILILIISLIRILISILIPVLPSVRLIPLFHLSESVRPSVRPD